MSIVYTKQASVELFQRIAPAFSQIRSGMTRITPIKYRAGDSAKLVKIEFTHASFQSSEQIENQTDSIDKTEKTEKKPRTPKTSSAPIAKKNDGVAIKSSTGKAQPSKPAARNRAPKSKG